jgi:branched-chain amino acid transport system permease protein
MSGTRNLVALSLLGAAVLLALPHLLAPYYLGLVVQMLVFALFAMSLDLLIGYGGMASLGHAA